MSLIPPPIGATQIQPIDQNFLASHRFLFVLQRTPVVEMLIQEIALPGLSLDYVLQPTSLIPIPRPGNKINYEDLIVTFKVDQQLLNWKEIAAWLVGLGPPQSYSQYKELSETYAGIVSDATLIIEDSSFQPVHRIFFHNIFPISLSGLNFDTKVNSTFELTATVAFKYTSWEFDDVNSKVSNN